MRVLPAKPMFITFKTFRRKSPLNQMSRGACTLCVPRAHSGLGVKKNQARKDSGHRVYGSWAFCATRLLRKPELMSVAFIFRVICVAGLEIGTISEYLASIVMRKT